MGMLLQNTARGFKPKEQDDFLQPTLARSDSITDRAFLLARNKKGGRNEMADRSDDNPVYHQPV